MRLWGFIANDQKRYTAYWEVKRSRNKVDGKSKATSILRGLSTLIPMQANLKKENGQIEIIPISELKKGNIVLIRNGESIPQDGLIIKGQGQIDESMITGESLPVNKIENDEVIGGSVLIDGLLEVIITSVPSTTILSNIINQTKESLTKKIPIEKLASLIQKSSYSSL